MVFPRISRNSGKTDRVGFFENLGVSGLDAQIKKDEVICFSPNDAEIITKFIRFYKLQEEGGFKDPMPTDVDGWTKISQLECHRFVPFKVMQKPEGEMSKKDKRQANTGRKKTYGRVVRFPNASASATCIGVCPEGFDCKKASDGSCACLPV